MGFWITGFRRKVVISMVIIGFFPLFFGLLLTYIRGTSELRKAMGANFEGLAGEVAHKTDLIIAKELSELQHYTSSSDLIRIIEASNRSYDGLTPSDTERMRKASEAAWNVEKISGNRSRGIIRNPGSIYLMKSTIDENKEKVNAALFVTDKMGAVVASINGYPKFWHQDDEWWKKTYNNGNGRIYLGNEYYDETAKTYVWEVAIPVLSERSAQIIGVIKAVININEFFKPSIFHVRFGKTGHAMLIDSDGNVIICPVLPTGIHITDKDLIAKVTAAQSGWIKAENDAHGGKNSIVGFAPIEDVNKILKGSVGKSWHSFIRQDPKELYSPLYAMLRDVIIYGILLVGVIVAVGMVLSERLVKHENIRLD